MKSNLPVPSKIFPNDRHRDIHDVVGRPKLVQRAVLVVDTLQENLEIWNQEKCYTIGFRLMGCWQNYILKTFQDEPHLAHSVFLLSHQQPEQRKMVVLDGRWLQATKLENCKRWFLCTSSSPPSPPLPPPRLPQSPRQLPHWCTYVQVANYLEMFPDPKDPLFLLLLRTNSLWVLPSLRSCTLAPSQRTWHYFRQGYSIEKLP